MASGTWHVTWHENSDTRQAYGIMDSSIEVIERGGTMPAGEERKYAAKIVR
jgi:hypothetical protein